jgi:channel protein (hemolysin III family)
MKNGWLLFYAILFAVACGDAETAHQVAASSADNGVPQTVNTATRELISIPGFADPVSCMTHLLAALVALIAGVLMILRFRGRKHHRLGLMFFVSGTVFMFSMSGVYHMMGPDGMARYVMQHLDHAAIFVMIAGSMTAIHLLVFKGWKRWGVIIVMWIATVNGIVFKTIWFDEFPEWLGLTIYLAMGWMGLITVYLVVKKMGLRPARTIVFGGVSYSLGAVVEFAQPPFIIPGVFGPHEFFHLAVIGGVMFHWKFMRRAVRMVRFDKKAGSPMASEPA